MLIRLKKVIIDNIVLVIIFTLYYFLNTYFKLEIPCIFYKVTGLLCPGCGITRCLFSLLHFNIKQALHYNAFVVIFLPIFLIYYIYYMYCYIMNKENRLINNKYITYLILIILILYGITRNIIGYPL